MDIRTAVPANLDGIRRYDRHIPMTRLEDCIRRGLVDVLDENGRMANREANMAAQGFADVLLSTQSDETSKFFYEKLGYTRCGSFLPPDQDVEELMYRKSL